jgi:hypothetical protein
VGKGHNPCRIGIGEDGEGDGEPIVSVMLMLMKRLWIVEVFVDALVTMEVAL